MFLQKFAHTPPPFHCQMFKKVFVKPNVSGTFWRLGGWSPGLLAPPGCSSPTQPKRKSLFTDICTEVGSAPPGSDGSSGWVFFADEETLAFDLWCRFESDRALEGHGSPTQRISRKKKQPCRAESSKPPARSSHQGCPTDPVEQQLRGFQFRVPRGMVQRQSAAPQGQVGDAKWSCCQFTPEGE